MSESGILPSTHRVAARQFAERLAAWPWGRFHADDVWADLLALAVALPDPMAYAQALDAVWHHLQVIARQQPGTPMRGRLNGWRRHKFPLASTYRRPSLRIVYRVLPDGAVELFGFGHRHEPKDVYQRWKTRIVPPKGS